MDSWTYQPAADLDQQLLDRLRRFPREPDILTYGMRSLAALTIRTWLRTYHRFEVIGKQHIPRTGLFVMVANHASHLDALCLMSAMPLRKLHRTFSAAAADYFFVSPRRAAMAVLVVNALPFNRELQIRQSLRLCRELLANPGNVLIVFPEGSRSPTGELRPFKQGVGLLVAGTNVPVLPCYLDGTYRAMPKHTAIPRPRRVRLTIGQPCVFANQSADKSGAAKISHDLHQAILQLSSLTA